MELARKAQTSRYLTGLRRATERWLTRESFRALDQDDGPEPPSFGPLGRGRDAWCVISHGESTMTTSDAILDGSLPATTHPVTRRNARSCRTVSPSDAKCRPASPHGPTKSTIVTKLLSRSRGATSAELADVTSWQPHTVRAFLSGLRKKGAVLAREQRRSGELAYRIAAAEAGVQASPASESSADAPAPNADKMTTVNGGDGDAGSDGDS